MWVDTLGPIPEPNSDGSELKALETQLRQLVFSTDVWRRDVTFRQPCFQRLPKDLKPLIHEAYLTALSERFSKAAHTGVYEAALEDGFTLLALYILIYPKNYPQIGKAAN